MMGIRIRGMLNPRSFGSWRYIIAALIAYYALLRLVFSLVTVPSASVFLEGTSCRAVGTPMIDSDRCNAIGTLSYTFTGDRWLTPSNKPNILVPVPKDSAVGYGAEPTHFPGGDLAMDCAVFLPFLILFTPALYGICLRLQSRGKEETSRRERTE